MPSPQKQKRKRTPGERPPKTPREDLPAQPIDDYPPRLATETPVAYARFCAYLDQPHPRSHRRVPFPSIAKRWSAAHAWVERAAQFDAARRKRRLHALDEAQLERDIRTLEADGRLADLARELLFDEHHAPTDADPTRPVPLLHVLARLARAGHVEFARIEAVKALVDFAGIVDLRKARLQKLKAPAPPTATANTVNADVVAALAEHATPGQLDNLCGDAIVDDPPAPALAPEPSGG